MMELNSVKLCNWWHIHSLSPHAVQLGGQRLLIPVWQITHDALYVCHKFLKGHKNFTILLNIEKSGFSTMIEPDMAVEHNKRFY